MTHVFQGAHAPRRVIAGLMLAAAALLAFAAPQAAEAQSKKAEISAMSLNLYFGADVEASLLSLNTATLKLNTGAAYTQLVASKPSKRLRGQAKIIAKQKPDVVGVQEAANVFTGPEGPLISRATTEKFNFLALLRKHLKNKGVPYRVANKQQNVDIEVPTDLGFNVRLVDHDAILVRKNKRIKVQSTSGANFATALQVPIPLTSQTLTTIPRGYTQANVKIRGVKGSIVNTHLESASPLVRLAQAQELAQANGPLDSNRPTILLGDLNSDPNGQTQAAYNAIIAAGLKNRSQTKNTCCYTPDLSSGPLTSLIDFVLASKGVKLDRSIRTGLKKPWPSDHAGVISYLRY